MKFLSRALPALKLGIPVIGVLALCIFSSFILSESMQATVVVTENGERQVVKTHSKTIEDLFDEMGISVGEYDSLSYELNKEVEQGLEINYESASQISLTLNGIEAAYHTTADTVEKFLLSEKLTVSDRDEISHEEDAKVEDGLHLVIDRAYQVEVDDGGEKKTIWTTGGSVEQFLDRNQILVRNIDKIKPAMDEDLDEDTSIQIVRIDKEKDLAEEKIAFKTEKKEDGSLAKGKERVVTEGKEGKLIKKYEIVLENGKEVDRELVSEKVAEEAKNKVVAIGTKQPEQKLVTLSSKSSSKSASKTSKSSPSKSSNSSPKGKTMYMTVTAYTAGCTGCSGITATGINLNANRNMKVIAVDPSVIPLGSRVWVEGYGNAVAGDTGGAIKGNRIDIHVPTKNDAYSYGVKRNVKVTVLD